VFQGGDFAGEGVEEVVILPVQGAVHSLANVPRCHIKSYLLFHPKDSQNRIVSRKRESGHVLFALVVGHFLSFAGRVPGSWRGRGDVFLSLGRGEGSGSVAIDFDILESSSGGFRSDLEFRSEDTSSGVGDQHPGR
jgi:hypothetical protein